MIPDELKQEIKSLQQAPPVPVVTPEGEPTRIEDYDSFMQFLMLASIASSTRKTAKSIDALHAFVKDWEGEGLTRRLELTVTTTMKKHNLPEKWQSFTLTNDGENDLKVWVNSTYTQDITVGPYETLNYDTKTHKIYRLYLKTVSGTTRARIIGSY